MPAFGLCAKFVDQAGSDPATILDVLYVFAQDNKAKIAVDSSGFALHKYEEIAKKNRDLKSWLRHLSLNKSRNMEFIDVEFENTSTDKQKFVEIARNIAHGKSMIVWSHQDYIGENTHGVNLIDRTDAPDCVRPCNYGCEGMNVTNNNFNVTGNVGIVGAGQISNTGVISQTSSNNVSSFFEDNRTDIDSQLRILLSKAKEIASNPDERHSCFFIEEAVQANIDKDDAKLVDYLKKAGKWAYGITEKVSIPVAAKALAIALGMGG